MIGPVFPRVCIDLSPNMVLPSLFRGRVGFSHVSCGTGYDRYSLVRALGEALERQFSFASVGASEPTHKLDELNPGIRNWVHSIFIDSQQSDLDKYIFTMKTVADRKSGVDVLAPSVAFTLSAHPDDRFMPSRDSSGSALHRTLVDAELGARRELCERQALTCFWYYGHINYSIDYVNNVNLIKSNSIRNMIEYLGFSGNVLLFDISLISPYRVCLAVFASQSGKVKFAAGAGADIDFDQAVEKAVIELYQAYVLMDQLKDSSEYYGSDNETGDEISRGYFASNTTEIASTFIQIHNENEIVIGDLSHDINWKAKISELHELVYKEVLHFPSEHEDLSFCSIRALLVDFPRCPR